MAVEPKANVADVTLRRPMNARQRSALREFRELLRQVTATNRAEETRLLVEKLRVARREFEDADG